MASNEVRLVKDGVVQVATTPARRVELEFDGWVVDNTRATAKVVREANSTATPSRHG